MRYNAYINSPWGDSVIKVLLADDEEAIREILTWYLEAEGYQVLLAKDGHTALQLEEEEKPDLLILDVLMPGFSGWEVARSITRQVPIIFLTALEHEEDKINGFRLGADDYVTKPFSPKELLARIKAVLRRNGKLPLSNDQLTFPALLIDPVTQCIIVNNNRVELTAKEFSLLFFLARHPHDTFSRDQLLLNIWGYDFEGDTRTVDSTVKRVRQKLGSVRNCIRTIRDCGYKFEAGL